MKDLKASELLIQSPRLYQTAPGLDAFLGALFGILNCPPPEQLTSCGDSGAKLRLAAVMEPAIARLVSRQERSADARLWRPDVHVHSFVPASFLEINHSPAVILPTPALGGVHFENYTATFMGSGFRPAPREPLLPQMHESIDVSISENLTREDYKHYFERCLALDLEAQSHEIRAYDIFGAPIEVGELSRQIYSLRVSGLRDGTPTVRYGDTLILRQLVIDHATKMPRDMDAWLAPGGGRDKNQPAPGFTGYQISAVVLGIDRKRETVIFHAPGILNSALVCNVSFVVQARAFEKLQAAVSSIAEDLPCKEVNTEGETTWLQCMLFPEKHFGVMQKDLPSALFSQTWRDQGLNYEQKVGHRSLP